LRWNSHGLKMAIFSITIIHRNKSYEKLLL